MTKKEMSTESALHDSSNTVGLSSEAKISRQRMRQYGILAAAFSYPDDRFFNLFPDLLSDKHSITAEYDRLFRAGKVWLYGAEHLVKNEFQRANIMADIMGFYTAFGLEPDKERPDSITCELDFMYGLIFKADRTSRGSIAENTDEKIEVCRDAQKKFFVEHLEPAAKLIAKKILSESNDAFYQKSAKKLLTFLRREKKYFNIKSFKEQKADNVENSSEK
jgi:TorA maturation chaperone TorD